MGIDSSTPMEVLEAAAAMGNIKDHAPELTAERLGNFNNLEITVEGDLSPLLAQINERLGLILASRPEGLHITVVGPTESGVLKTMTAEQLAELQEINRQIQLGEGVTVKGVGLIGKDRPIVDREGQTRVPKLRAADQTKTACFVAVDIPALNAFRTKLIGSDGKPLPPKDFHFTLGFQNTDAAAEGGGDIHEEVTGEVPMKPGSPKMKEIRAAIPKRANPEFADLEMPSITFGGLNGTEKEKKQS